MSEAFNPFEHHHDHGPDAGEGDPMGGGASDPAQKALADALRVTFTILKLVMLVLLVMYMCSGIFSVKTTEYAVLLRCGQIVGEPGQQVLAPGWHISWPYPIDQVVKLDRTIQNLNIDKTFWFEVPPGQEDKPVSELMGRPLNPERDGSLLTGDGSIVHARWVVTWQVAEPVGYLRNVTDAATAEALVRAAAEEGAVYAVAQLSADDAFASKFRSSVPTERAQMILDAQNTGIKITVSLQQGGFVFPLSVRDAFEQVTNAQNEKMKRLADADSNRSKKLSQAAGEAADALKRMIEAYDRAKLQHDDAALARLDSIFDRAFTDPSMELPADGRTYRITGDAAAAISRARSDKDGVVKKVRGMREIFDKWEPSYLENPSLVYTILWQEARRKILSGDVEKYVIPDGQQPWFSLNRDPNIRKQRMQEAIDAAKGKAGGKP